MARQFAVFDVDGTIVRTSLLQLIIKAMVNRGLLDGAAAGDIERILHDGRQRIPDGDFGGYMKLAVDQIIKHCGGKLRLDDYNAAVAEVGHTFDTATYVYTRQLIETLRHNNFFLIAISGSELHAVETVAKALGFHAFAAGVEYVNDGTFITGDTHPFSGKKDEILNDIITKHGLTTKGSIGIGDTSRDIPVFSMVTQPIAFNPNQELFKIAREKGWMVVLERKDVVYGLQPVNGEYVLKSVNV